MRVRDTTPQGPLGHKEPSAKQRHTGTHTTHAPAGQAVQLLAVPVLYRPTPQVVQEPAPAAENWPAGQTEAVAVVEPAAQA